MIAEQVCKLTIIIHKVLTTTKMSIEITDFLSWAVSYSTIAFRQYHQLMPRDIELLDCLSDDLLGNAIAVDICCIPRVQASVVRCF